MEECSLSLLLLLLLWPAACAEPDCSQPQHPGLSCYNDYNRTMTCEWNSSAQLSTTTCWVLALRRNYPKYIASCILKPEDISRPTVRMCSMMFWKDGIFLENHVLRVSLNCNTVEITVEYKPVCHIQLSRPQKPKINSTTVSWSPQGCKDKPSRFTGYISEMQWREVDQPWTSRHEIGGEWLFQAQLEKSKLIRGKQYEAQVRVKPRNKNATWSEWSPVASWESEVETSQAHPPPVFAQCFLGTVTAVTVAFALVLAFVLLKTDRSTWADMVKKIQGPMLPNPEKPLQAWVVKSTYFSRESFDFLLKPVEIVPVEVVHTVDAMEPFGPEEAPLLLEGVRGNGDGDTSKSSFSNPSYSQLCPSTPPQSITTLTAGNLKPCAADSPYGPVDAQGQEDAGRKEEIQQLLSKGQNEGEALQIVSDYEKVEQVGHGRLQSLDSGVCSGDEPSQESLEPDSIGEEAEPAGSPAHLGSLLDKFGSGRVVSRGSIQVVSDYERVEAGSLCSPELPSLDSGLSSAGEEQASQEESLEESRFLFPSPIPLSALLLSPPLPLSLLNQRALEPCAEGYMSKKS